MADAAKLSDQLSENLKFGTSSWTYPGWTGLVYGKRFPKTGASTAMLAAYARCPLFRTVGVDSFYYRPPSPDLLSDYRQALPAGFPLVMKVWDRITSFGLRSPRYRDANTASGGTGNPDWLNPSLFTDAVLAPAVEYLGAHASVFLFELEAIPLYAHFTADRLATRLDNFFAALPQGAARYAVEIRSPELLEAPYFEILKKWRVAHVFNSWTRMPRISQQLQAAGGLGTDFTVARALLQPGHSYSRAVEAFGPYDQIKASWPTGRKDLLTLVNHALAHKATAYILVNNRFEGCSPLTIAQLAREFIGQNATTQPE